ncbi:hypothetical protein KFL_002520040 [Klebsormidium nitens]|uniref:2-haloacid dehalogenase n=1 Tax=Klebsormidium nitens TaxID=105231 RepID=A0A1Y1I488_KLENI|nr:hypothetical protein KFL_002520040 [Klebsormidium nitens]|eukprot:GAQ85745.1 hypothetical protein KFL_002520040 [Klebsormidium nitens]
MTEPEVLIFDVNETLLDFAAALEPIFKRIFGVKAEGKRQAWFGMAVHSAFTAIITKKYCPFGAHAMSAITMLGQQNGVTVSDEDKEALKEAIHLAPPHPEVDEALALLKDAGFRLAALTNNAQNVVDMQLKNAGLTQYFEKILSADTIKVLKPAPEPYEFAAKEMGLSGPAEMRMVAAHCWDCAGAMRAGAKAAFVDRPSAAWDPLVERTDVVGSDLLEVAKAIVAKRKST